MAGGRDLPDSRLNRMTLSRKQTRPSRRKPRSADCGDAEGAGAAVVGKGRAEAATAEEAEAELKVAVTWWLYVLRCADRSLYCGITNDVERRLARHNAGTGARYTRGRGPLVLERSWPAGSKAEALKMEHRFKKLRKARKEQVVKEESGWE